MPWPGWAERIRALKGQIWAIIAGPGPMSADGTDSAVPLLMKVHAVTQLVELPQEARTELDDPPCDLSAFIALNRGIDLNAAGRLIEDWLSHYRPLSVVRVVTSPAEQARDAAADYDICA